MSAIWNNGFKPEGIEEVLVGKKNDPVVNLIRARSLSKSSYTKSAKYLNKVLQSARENDRLTCEIHFYRNALTHEEEDLRASANGGFPPAQAAYALLLLSQSQTDEQTEIVLVVNAANHGYGNVIACFFGCLIIAGGLFNVKCDCTASEAIWKTIDLQDVEEVLNQRVKVVREGQIAFLRAKMSENRFDTEYARVVYHFAAMWQGTDGDEELFAFFSSSFVSIRGSTQ